MRMSGTTSTPISIRGTAAPALEHASRTRSYEVAPGASTRVERHAEMEVSVVVTGSALVEIASRIFRVEQGGAFVFESMEWHVVHNDSADVTLVIQSARMMPGAVVVTSRLGDLAASISGLGLGMAA